MCARSSFSSPHFNDEQPSRLIRSAAVVRRYLSWSHRNARLHRQEQRRHESRKSPTKAVQCVAVAKDDKLIGRGRVVFMTSKAIVLFEPKDGTVRKVPTADAVIEVVPAL